MLGENIPWKGEYRIMGIPSSLSPYPKDSVYSILEKASKKYKRNGVVQGTFKLTYPELKSKVDNFVSSLLEFGLEFGDRVATILPTSIQFVISDYAISRCGFVHIPSSSLEPFETLKYKFQQASPKIVICLKEHYNLALKLKKSGAVEKIILTEIEDCGVNEKDENYYLDFSNDKDVYWMAQLTKSLKNKLPKIAIDSENDIETLLFTGGTTGLPKGCMLTHKNIYSNVVQNLYSIGQIGLLLKGKISVLLALPFFHSYGHLMMHSMMAFGFNQLLVPDPRDTDSMVAMMDEYYPLLQIGVPAQFMKMANKGAGNKGMICLSGSAPLAKNTQDEFEKKVGGGFLEGYGLSEMSPTTHLNTSILVRMLGGRKMVALVNNFLRIPGIKSFLSLFLLPINKKFLGKIFLKFSSLLMDSSKKSKKHDKLEKRGTFGVPFPNTEVKFLDIEDGDFLSYTDMKNGEKGEMLLSGPQRMLGYWPTTGDGFDENGFIHTGDVVVIDEHGYFRIVDRTKDMIIVSGYKVYSREVDEILFLHPKIEMAATVGVPDKENEGSERVVVCIKPKDQFLNDITSEEVIDYLKERVAKYSIPKLVMFLDEIPLTAVEKVDKKEIRKIAEEQWNLFQQNAV